MTLEEKAIQYASKMLKDQIDMLAQAYMDGYNDKNTKYDEPIRNIIDRESIPNIVIEYVDLKLPSGNLWSFPLSKTPDHLFEQSMYYNTVRDWSLPTEEDLTELLQNTKSIQAKRDPFFSRTHYCSSNGARLILSNNFLYWMKTNDENQLSEIPVFNGAGNITKIQQTQLANVVLVKKKNK